MPSALRTLFNIQPEERRPFWLLITYSFLTGITIVFAYTASISLFLTEFGPQNLPYVYIAAAIVMVVIGSGYARLETRLSAVNFFNVAIGFLFITAVLLWAAYFAQQARWLTFVLLIWFRLLFSLVNLTYWSAAGQILTLQQAKRLFGLIGIGEVVAFIIGYASVPLFVELLGTANLLLLTILALALTQLILLQLRRYLPTSKPQTRETAVSEPIAWRELLRDGYTRLIFLSAFITIMVYFFVDFGFFNEVRDRFNDADTVAEFMGLFWTIVYAVSLFVRLFVTAPLLKRFGLQAGLLFMPISLILVLGLFVLASFVTSSSLFLFFLIGLAKLLDDALSVTVHRSASTLLYQPLAEKSRLVSQVLAESVIVPMGIGLAGVALLLLNSLPNFNSRYFALFLLVVFAIWVVVSRRTYRHYVHALERALSQHRLRGNTQFLDDASSLTVIEKKLQSQHSGEVLYALHLLETAVPSALPSAISNLLSHPNDLIIKHALLTAAHLNLQQTLPAIRVLVRDRERAGCRPTAVRVLCALEEPNRQASNLNYLNHYDEAIVLAALVGLLQQPHAQSTTAAKNRLCSLVHSAAIDQRIQAAYAIGEIGCSDFDTELAQLLADDSIAVQRAALAAVGKVPASTRWATPINTALNTPKLRGTAVSTLLSLGDWPLLDAALAEHHADPTILAQLLQICGQLGGKTAVSRLLPYIDHPHSNVRKQTVQALRQVGFQAKTPSEKAGINQQLQREVETIAWLAACMTDLIPAAQSDLIGNALTQTWRNSQAQIFLLLACLYDPQMVARAERDLQQKQSKKQAFAQELLTTVLTSAHRQQLLPALCESSLVRMWPQLKKQTAHQPTSYEQRLAYLLRKEGNGVDDWLLATAVYEAGLNKIGSLASLIEPLTQSRNKRVQETAVWAQKQLATP